MNKLSDYLMKHHLSAMGNEANANVEDAALEVIKAQDAALDAAQKLMVNGLSMHIDIFGFSDWLFQYAHPTSPAQKTQTMTEAEYKDYLSEQDRIKCEAEEENQ